jgi:hypothetical protein
VFVCLLLTRVQGDVLSSRVVLELSPDGVLLVCMRHEVIRIPVAVEVRSLVCSGAMHAAQLSVFTLSFGSFVFVCPADDVRGWVRALKVCKEDVSIVCDDSARAWAEEVLLSHSPRFSSSSLSSSPPASGALSVSPRFGVRSGSVSGTSPRSWSRQGHRRFNFLSFFFCFVLFLL